MNFDCTIAVFANFEDAASAVRKLEQKGVSEDQLTLVLHDFDGELPAGVVLDRSHSRTLVDHRHRKGMEAGGDADPIRRLERLFSTVTGDLFSGLLERFRGTTDSHELFEEYQRDVQAGKLLLVMCGRREEVDQAARVLANTGAIQVNVHYA